MDPEYFERKKKIVHGEFSRQLKQLLKQYNARLILNFDDANNGSMYVEFNDWKIDDFELGTGFDRNGIIEE